MPIETKFLIGAGELGSRLRVIITPPDLEVLGYNMMTAIMSVSPVKLGKVIEGVEGVYVFPQSTGQDWEILPETGELNRITLTGFRVE